MFFFILLESILKKRVELLISRNSQRPLPKLQQP